MASLTRPPWPVLCPLRASELDASRSDTSMEDHLTAKFGWNRAHLTSRVSEMLSERDRSGSNLVNGPVAPAVEWRSSTYVFTSSSLADILQVPSRAPSGDISPGHGRAGRCQ